LPQYQVINHLLTEHSSFCNTSQATFLNLSGYHQPAQGASAGHPRSQQKGGQRRPTTTDSAVAAGTAKPRSIGAANATVPGSSRFRLARSHPRADEAQSNKVPEDVTWLRSNVSDLKQNVTNTALSLQETQTG